MIGFVLTSIALAAPAAADASFEQPFRVRAEGAWIDVEVGHAAPLLADVDGDGREELLVGQFGEGKLRIYEFEGKPSARKLGSYRDFEAAEGTGKIPAG